MPLELSTLTGIGPKDGGLGRLAPAAVGGAPDTSAFASQLGSLIEGVEEASTQANAAVSGMIDKTTDVHDAMIALQRAEMSLQLTVQIRNKLVSAYQEIMRMPV